MIKIQYYSTNIGVFFKIDASWPYQNLQALNIVEVNGKDVTSLVPNNGWYHFEGELKDLMLEINKPVVECQHCNGLGCITKTIGTNERGG